MNLTRNELSPSKKPPNLYSLEYSVHGPFADINIASPSKTMLDASMKRLKQSMAYANALDAKLWVFHPGAKTGIGQFYPNGDWKQNIKSIQELSKTAEEYGLNIALENLPAKYYFFMSKAEDFTRFYRETNLPVGIVMDLGHANLEGQIEPFFNMLADKITHIHASDNDGVEDQHLGVGQGKIDYAWFAETINKMSYDKSVIIESITNITRDHPKTYTASRLVFFKRHLNLQKILALTQYSGRLFLPAPKAKWHQGILR